MTEASEKSTDPARASVHPDVVLDARLAIFHQRSRWLALADVHYGYEVARRAEGGLWPLWGMGAIEERLAGLLDDYAPETVILVGDVIDRGVVIPSGLVVGEDPDEDRKWFRVTENGVTLITQSMLDRREGRT